ncbi:cilia- and flagella-associated protein 70 isoform X3 [Hemibagrus wyckioides]|uniref:cilia- and flagella-associated protein 70 isoform X3 n=1 Tax=Hemibagrus wyckioides TaxID=337641 RepID=UPI00266DD0D8|nr:cilia- and flagella-associated protein 70 isoform X3 [Hemibagrus wyckioides]
MDQGATGVAVQMTVLRGENLRGNKNQSFLSFVRAEFNGVVLGDSQRLHVPVDERVNYNFTCSFECSEVTHTLDDLAHKPVILTLIEIFPKEEKQKEEKTSVLGQAVVDLLPLLHGQCTFSSIVELHPTQGSPYETVSQDKGIKPTLEVTVSTPEPLLSDIQLSESNLLTVTVETAYSVPEVWNAAATGPQHSYIAALQVPLTSQKKEQLLLFSNGILKMGGEREPVHRAKKWPRGSFLTPDAQFIPGMSIVDEPVNLDHNDLNTFEDEVFRAEAECNRKRVSWDTERRCFIDAGGVTCLSRRIVECRFWPVEVMRCTQFGSNKAGGGKVGKEKPVSNEQLEDEIQISFHGVAYVDFALLLYPGVRRIRGVYRIHPFSESDLLMKTKRQASVVSESVKALVAEACLRPTSSCKAASSKVLGGKESKEEMKKAKPAQTESVTDVEPQVNTDAQMYADSRSYIIIEIALEKPLVPKRQPEELARRVRELIPPRPPRPRHSAGAEKAVQEYQAQIMSVGVQVLQQYEQMFGAAFVPGARPLDPATQEQRKTQLFGELNCSGKYFAFKEQMKYSVVRIVREKMLRTEAFTNPEQLQAFLSQLYIFLVDEMHVALNKTLSAKEQELQAQPLLDCSQLMHFAKEALLHEDYQLAAYYYQELAQDRSNPSHWFNYGVFYMSTAEYVKAEECFHLAISVDQEHIPSLLMCGILSEMNSHYEEAETFFERATCIDSSSVVTWTIIGLFYLAQQNFIQAEMAFIEATKQQRAALACSSPEQRTETACFSHSHSEDNEPVDKPAVEGVTESATEGQDKPQSSQNVRAEEGDKTRADPVQTFPQNHHSPTRVGTTIYMETVEFLLQSYALQMAQRALAQELLCPDGGPGSSYFLALAQIQLLRGEYSSAEASLQQALSHNFQNPDVWALYGHMHYMMKDYNQAQDSYERTLDFVTDASDTHPVYLRLGSIYIQKGQYDKAKPTYMLACKSSPSCLTWLGLGIACYRLEELTESEDALTEANALNNRNPEVWGYLSLICLQTGRKLEAEQSFKYAVKFNVSEALLQEITDVQTRVGFGNPCFS